MTDVAGMILPVHRLTVNEIVNHRSQFGLFVSSSTTDKEFNFHQVFKLLKQACAGKHDVVSKHKWHITGFIHNKYFSIFFVNRPQHVTNDPTIFIASHPNLISFDQPIDTKYYAFMHPNGFQMIHDKRVIDAYPKSVVNQPIEAPYQSMATGPSTVVNDDYRVDHCAGYDRDIAHCTDQTLRRLTRSPEIPSH